MVQLFPAELRPAAPYSEELVFNALQDVKGKADWLALHSIKLNQVKGKAEAELDFIVFIPKKGIVFVEAKGATSADVNHTEWVLEGVPPGAATKNPFDQIDEGRRSVRKVWKTNGFEVDNIPMARLVWFPHMDPFDLTKKNAQFDLWETAFQKDLESAEKALFLAIDEEARSKNGNRVVKYEPAKFTVEFAEQLIAALTPSFGASMTPENTMVERRHEVRRATEEQLVLLDLVAKNNLIYFEGEAGSGKTEILSRAAVNLTKESRKVLFTCYNEMLCESIREDIGLHQSIEVMHFNEVLLWMAGLKKNPKDAGTEWYDKELPQLARDKFLKSGKVAPFDAICIDEFQDLASREEIFYTLMVLLNSKFRPFKVMMAGDDEQQIAASGARVDSFAFAKKVFPNLTHVALTANCRQAPGLSKAIHKLLNWPMAVKKHRLSQRIAWRLEVIATTEANREKDLYRVLNRLTKDNPSQQVRVLSPWGEKSSVLAKLWKQTETHSREARELKKITARPEHGGLIRWRSIAKYKGLENDVVVITDINNDTKKWVEAQGKSFSNQLYVGMTRARFHVVLLVEDGLFKANSNTDGTPV